MSNVCKKIMCDIFGHKDKISFIGVLFAFVRCERCGRKQVMRKNKVM
jgi:C4-type Zn-finger protein